MSDEPDSPDKKKSVKKLIIMAGGALAFVSLLVAGLAMAIIKVDKFHKMWCKNAGLFCPKVVVAAAPPPVVPPAGCPDFKIQGSLTTRQATDPTATLVAEVNGHVSLNREGWISSGDSSVSCNGGQFLASFTGMSHGTIYQCVGAIDGKRYSGVCNLSKGGPSDINGVFVN